MPTTTRGRTPRLPDLLAAGVLLALACAVGCATKQWSNPPTELLDSSWHNRGPSDPYPNPDSTLADGLASVFGNAKMPAPAPGRALNVLAVSGGGKHGSYTAGVLCGWTENGTRPQFDVCTGISSGALVAALAFLGPDYDGRLAHEFNNLSQRDVLRFQPVRGLVTTSSLASSKPLSEMIARNLDAKAFADVQAAHHAGRRLFVSTVNLTTQRAVIWDVGALATSGRPDARDLVHKVLLAACTIPGFMPPVEFDIELNGVRYKELHVDAGNVIQAFVRTANGLPPTSNVYVINAGKIYRDPLEEEPRFLRVLGASISNTMYALFREDAVKLYALCAVTGAHFHLVAIPTSLKVRPGSMTFDEEEMRLLFSVGRQQALGGIPWRHTPPASQPGETLVPRGGLEFVAEPCPR